MRRITRFVGLGSGVHLVETECTWVAVAVVHPGGRSLTCLPAVGTAPEQWSSTIVGDMAPADLLMLKWMGRGIGCALGFKIWSLGQFIWKASHSPVLPMVQAVPVPL